MKRVPGHFLLSQTMFSNCLLGNNNLTFNYLFYEYIWFLQLKKFLFQAFSKRLITIKDSLLVIISYPFWSNKLKKTNFI